MATPRGHWARAEVTRLSERRPLSKMECCIRKRNVLNICIEPEAGANDKAEVCHGYELLCPLPQVGPDVSPRLHLAGTMIIIRSCYMLLSSQAKDTMLCPPL